MQLKRNIIILAALSWLAYFTWSMYREKQRRNDIHESRCQYIDSIVNESSRQLALIISGECLQCNYFEKRLVASVVLNRVRSGIYPNTIENVISQENAFQGLNGLQYAFDEECYDVAYDALTRGPADSSVVFFYRNNIRKPKYVKTIIYREQFHNFGK